MCVILPYPKRIYNQFVKEGDFLQINYSGIGKRVKDFRKNLNITQAKLGEISDVEPSNISHIERGVAKVSLPTLIKIANALNVSLDELVYDSIIKCNHISIKEISELLSDCNESEIKNIAEMIKSTKEILRNK